MLRELLQRASTSAAGLVNSALPPLPIRFQLSFGPKNPIVVSLIPNLEHSEHVDIAERAKEMNSYYAALYSSFHKLARILEAYSRSNEEIVYLMRDRRLLL